MATEETIAMDKVWTLEKEILKLETEITTEETTCRENSDLIHHPRYNTLKRELEDIRVTLSVKQGAVDNNFGMYKSKRVVMIEAIREKSKREIEALEAKARREIDALENEINNYQTSSDNMNDTIDKNLSAKKDSIYSKMKEIEDTIGIPTSLPYRRKKVRVEELKVNLDQAKSYLVEKTVEGDAIRARKRREIREQGERDIKRAEEDERRRYALEATIARAQNDEAEKKSRQRRIKLGLEPDDDGVYHTPE
jgi:hypothetical protein